MVGCPVGISTLGHSTWNLIHTIAEYIPEQPTEEEQRQIASFMELLATLYPCSICRDDFIEYVQRNPPRVQSRDEFALWCCEMHNDVHVKLGKDPVPCDREALRERWYLNTKDPACAIVDHS